MTSFTFSSRLSCSVIIPCFNHGRFLAEALKSVGGQTVPVHEVLVVDDGSTDDSAAITAEFRDVRYVRQENEGVAAARNRGLDLVTGTHALFLDADDILAPSFVEECARMLFDSDAGYAYATAQLTGAGTVTVPPRPFSISALKRQNFVPVTVLIDRAKLGDVRFDNEIDGWEDWEFFVHLATQGVYGVPAPEAVFYYRKHDGKRSRLDSHLRDPRAEPRAVRYMQRKHRHFYTAGERLETGRVLLRRRGWVIKSSLKHTIEEASRHLTHR